MTDNGEARTRLIRIVNKRGLHARASAKFVKCVEQFDADIRVSKDGHVVGGTSIMGLMMLTASPGCNINVTATGPQADEAIEAIQLLVDDKFGERFLRTLQILIAEKRGRPRFFRQQGPLRCKISNKCIQHH